VEHQLGPATIRRQGVFDPAAVRSLVEAHQAGRENLSRNLWGLLMFGLWYERMIEGR
jgi:asparagine synthase (glutamine-hydrolysing)